MRNGEQMLRYNYFEESGKLKRLQTLADSLSTSVSDLIRQGTAHILSNHSLIVDNSIDATADPTPPDPVS